MVLLLLMAAGGVMFTAVLCVLRAKSSRSEVRADTDRVYDTIQEREVIATDHMAMLMWEGEVLEETGLVWIWWRIQHMAMLVWEEEAGVMLVL